MWRRIYSAMNERTFSISIRKGKFEMVLIITGRNEVVAKVMFLQVSVILLTGGCLPQCMMNGPKIPFY